MPQYPKKDAESKARRLLKQFGLEEHLKKYPYMLSGGQAQRTAIARTLALNPDVMLFDEPMSALDASTRLVMMNEIKALNTRLNKTIIYITHDSEEAFTLSSKIAVLDENGVIHQIATPNEIITNPKDEYVMTFVLNNLMRKYNALKDVINQE